MTKRMNGPPKFAARDVLRHVKGHSQGIGFVYLLTGLGSAARLVVSLYTLRQWYGGPVTLFTTRRESHEIGELCSSERRLRVRHSTLCELPGEGITSSYLTKPLAVRSSPYRKTVFLDADTMVAGPLDELLRSAHDHEVTITTFCGLTTTERRTRRELGRWRKLQNTPGDIYQLEQRLDWVLGHTLPKVNTGILAVQRQSPILAKWPQLAVFGRDMPLPDESAFQLLLVNQAHCMLGSTFNCQPMAYPDDVPAKIWHFAGGYHLSDDACRRIWLPAYRECERLNVARITSWSRIRRERRRNFPNRH
jgi:hypothetical protein